MAQSTLRLDTRRALQDGTFPVQIVVGHGTNLYLPTDIYLLPEHWDERLKKCVGGKGYGRINSILDTRLSAVKLRILELKERGQWQSLTYAQKRDMLLHMDLEQPNAGRLTLAAALDKVSDGKPAGTLKIYQQTRRYVNEFAGDAEKVYVDTITLAWVEDFAKSMTALSINSRAIYLKCLRHALNYACNHDYIAKSPFRLFKIKQEETRMRVLPVEKLRLLAQTDFPRHYNEYRDFFLLTFFLIGINTVDLADCTRDSIVNGRLEYRRHKTGKIYSIKIEPEAMAIINRYRGRKHLLRWFDKYEDFKPWQGTCNNALSRLEIDGERLQRGLTLYWARYSWATYAAELDVSKDTISEALGHSYGSNITGVYIQFKREKIDVANRKVIDYVLNESGL